MIQRHYKRMAILTHPDKNRSNPKAQMAFEYVTKAWGVLRDDDMRAEYLKKVVAKLQNSRDRSWRPLVGNDASRDMSATVAAVQQTNAMRMQAF